MGKQHIDKNGAIHLRQIKAGAALVIPVHSILQGSEAQVMTNSLPQTGSQ